MKNQIRIKYEEKKTFNRVSSYENTHKHHLNRGQFTRQSNKHNTAQCDAQECMMHVAKCGCKKRRKEKQLYDNSFNYPQKYFFYSFWIHHFILESQPNTLTYTQCNNKKEQTNEMKSIK